MKRNRKNSILIIDDERDNISTLKAILSPEYTVYASTSGKDAIETANEFLPDVILLDVLMPDMDGYDVITEFKKSDITRDIPVIFITRLDNINAEIKGLALGATDYIMKPFHPVIVKLRIQNHIQIVEQLKQQTLVTKIAHNYLVKACKDKLHTDTLRIVGEFLDIAAIMLYKNEKNYNFICQNEWINPELKVQTCIGNKLELNEQIISNINNLLSGNEKDLCLQSNNPLFNDLIITDRKNFINYIAAPIFIKEKMSAILVFSREDDEREWSKSETDLAVLVASILSGVFERDAIQYEEYLSRAKSEFLSRMSHEMRTPLNAIIGILQVFNLLGVPENIKEHCNVMDSSAQTLLHLINDVLDVSDMEYGSFKLSEAAFDFKKMTWDILREADNKASKKQQLLDCNIDVAIPSFLFGDEKRLKQVFNTLLINAIKFTPENGEISFNASLVSEEKNIITIMIEVEDNGIGIPKDLQDKVFNIFEQADKSVTREYSGAGIGLAFSKRIIEMMDGNITVKSELNKGSKFSFTFKMKRDK